MHGENADGARYVVGFFVVGLPGTSEIWRPAEDSEEACDAAEARARFATLCRSMLAGETVEGLRLASAFVRDADDGETLVSCTADGCATATEEAGDTFETAAARLLLIAASAAQSGLSPLAGAMLEAAETGGGTALA